MTVCTGRGGGDVGGGHCCWVNGEVCQFLDFDGDLPRCTIWTGMSGPVWDHSPIGRMYAARHPGKNYTCRDWPQDIPAVMAAGVGLCCWSD